VVEKRHDNLMRDIRMMLAELHGEDSGAIPLTLRHAIKVTWHIATL